MPPPSDPPADALLAGAGSWLRIDQPDAVTHSHLPDGRRLGWHGPVPSGSVLAIDAEISAAPVPPALARRFGTDRFWERWTRSEALCKLAGVPILVWLETHGLDATGGPGVRWRTLALGDLTVTVALGSIGQDERRST
ncbi:hypothetical protein [Hamadaea tsunoensis]|uniref:hypothetical protein n=1 Tax=Hamadaea tsunoensis TaxID=53368 RepID=UPI00040E8D71|nr:hypothetical protein [Hamadaea tsunoensis]